jgi:hypothetical protein
VSRWILRQVKFESGPAIAPVVRRWIAFYRIAVACGIAGALGTVVLMFTLKRVGFDLPAYVLPLVLAGDLYCVAFLLRRLKLIKKFQQASSQDHSNG